MGIKYFIYETRLQNQTRFVGRVSLRDTYDQDRLVDRMLEMGTLNRRGFPGDIIV